MNADEKQFSVAHSASKKQITLGKLVKLPFKFVITFLIMASASPVGAQTLETICSFDGINGANPYAGLTLGNDGNFYGTTWLGGANPSGGTVFKVTTNGTLTTIVSFVNSNTNGWRPVAGLTLGNDGNFYGTTQTGSSGNYGTVFKVTTNGTVITLVSFANTNGANPQSTLTMGNDGVFYGTTMVGGNTGLNNGSGYGTVFKVTTNGTLTKLVSFANNNGAYVSAELTLGNDGNFYGTTEEGGSTNSTYINGMGTVFKVTTDGTLTTLANFTDNNGRRPHGALTMGRDGNFYGTTHFGGSGYGTVFKVTTNGTVITLVSFANTNGANPDAALSLGYDGNFYGTTERGGNGDYGTAFQVTTNGTLTTLAFFAVTNGQFPYAALTLGNDGNFYGTTLYGGSSGNGTVFRLFPPPPLFPVIIVQPKSQTNNAGATAAFLVNAIGANPLSFQWQKNGTNLMDGGNLSGATTNALTITGIADVDAANYSVIVTNTNGSVTSSIASLTVISPPFITAQPTNLMVLSATNVTFGVSLTGTATFRYQWRFNGTNLLNATNALYTISSVTTNKAGNYSVVVTNAAGSVTSSNAALTVVLSPKSQTNYASSTATFTATAYSPKSLSYRWQGNGTNLVDGSNLSGTTNITLTIASVSDLDAAIYNAVVSDDSGSVVTSNAVLTVNNFLFIAAQPQNQTGVAGGRVTFSVTVYGAPPFVFQWYFNDLPVGLSTAGPNFATYTLTNLGTNQSGNYKVQVFNGYGNLTSSNAWLTVIEPPKLGLQLLAGYPLLNLYGISGSNFVVQYNTNLAGTNWVNLLSLTNLSASPYQFLDPAGARQPARFYRAFMH